MKLTFHEVVRLEPAAEAQVFLSLFIALAFDLDQIGEQISVLHEAEAVS